MKPWPELSEADYRTLCLQMRLHVADVKQGDVVALKAVFAKALAAVHRPSAQTKAREAVDLSMMPRCSSLSCGMLSQVQS